MEAKLNALMVIILFISLSAIGLLFKLVLKFDFDIQIFFWYILLLCFGLMLFGRPIVTLAIDLVKSPYRDNVESFPVPGENLKDSAEARSKRKHS
jgi:predicted membrane channel-forming protein YqfA (hemolysin III family)